MGASYADAVISPKDGNWQLVTPLSWEVGKAGTGLFIEAPAGFVTDLASIPWWGRFAFNPGDGRTAKAAIVHDFLLYEDWCHMTAAGEFYNALRVDGVSAWRRVVMYFAVLLASDRW